MDILDTEYGNGILGYILERVRMSECVSRTIFSHASEFCDISHDTLINHITCHWLMIELHRGECRNRVIETIVYIIRVLTLLKVYSIVVFAFLSCS